MRKVIIAAIAASALSVPATAGATKTCTSGTYGLHNELVSHGSVRVNDLTCNQANYSITHGWLFGQTPYMYVSTRGYSCKALAQSVPPGGTSTTGQNVKCVSRTNSSRWFRFSWAQPAVLMQCGSFQYGSDGLQPGPGDIMARFVTCGFARSLAYYDSSPGWQCSFVPPHMIVCHPTAGGPRLVQFAAE